LILLRNCLLGSPTLFRVSGKVSTRARVLEALLASDNPDRNVALRGRGPLDFPHHLGFGVSSFGFRVSRFGSQVSGLRSLVSGGCRVSGLGFRVSLFGFSVSCFGYIAMSRSEGEARLISPTTWFLGFGFGFWVFNLGVWG